MKDEHIEQSSSLWQNVDVVEMLKMGMAAVEDWWKWWNIVWTDGGLSEAVNFVVGGEGDAREEG